MCACVCVCVCARAHSRRTHDVSCDMHWVRGGARAQEMRRRPAGTSSVDPHNKKLARAEGKDSMPPRYTADVMARYTYFYSAETPASMMALLAQQFSLLSGVTKEPESE